MKVTPTFYAKVRNNIPWDAALAPSPIAGQWVAPKEKDGIIPHIFHVTQADLIQATMYHTNQWERLHYIEQFYHPVDAQLQELRVVQWGGPKRFVFDFNPKELDPKHALWL